MWSCLDNPRGDTRDVVICSIPWTDSNMPLMAPAVLKPIVEKAGLTCLAVDLNAEVYHYTRDHPLREDLIKFFFDEVGTPDVVPVVENIYRTIAEEIVAWRPKWVGLSVFTYVCQHSAKWIAYYIKRLDPGIKILAGGAGCLPNFTGPSEYVDHMLQQGLFDYHIRGDGENSLYELLRGNTDYEGINSLEWRELEQEELRSLPMPDYSLYNFDLYDKKALPIVGSRGCVRQCKFCDYIANWKRFQWRTADDIFDEMITQSQRYGIRFFKFQDSLTNGNQKEFFRLIERLAEYNLTPGNARLSWSGFFIFREPTPRTQREWQLLADSGAETLAVGIENVNEHIRFAIGKKFSNHAIDIHFAQAKRHGIQLVILNIVGYVNEVEADIDFTKQWLRDHVEYRDILMFQWGGTLGIFPNTYLERNKTKLGVRMIGPQPSLWVNDSIASTPALRARWATELNQLSKDLGFRIFEGLDNHFLLETLIKTHE
jgi:radical SAM superfamily enzyme YgiQ (UPF0313 family)